MFNKALLGLLLYNTVLALSNLYQHSSCLSTLCSMLNMEQEETKGCFSASIDAPDPGQGLCTISFAEVSQKAVSMPHCWEVDWICWTLSGWRVKGKGRGLRVARSGEGGPRRVSPRRRSVSIRRRQQCLRKLLRRWCPNLLRSSRIKPQNLYPLCWMGNHDRHLSPLSPLPPHLGHCSDPSKAPSLLLLRLLPLPFFRLQTFFHPQLRFHFPSNLQISLQSLFHIQLQMQFQSWLKPLFRLQLLLRRTPSSQSHRAERSLTRSWLRTWAQVMRRTSIHLMTKQQMKVLKKTIRLLGEWMVWRK